MPKGKQLAMYIAGYGARAFDWASANCCHLSAGWVLQREGLDVMQGIKTPTEKSARRFIRDHGGTLADVWTQRLGREPIAPALAQVGDVVLLDQDGRPIVGICNGITAVAVLESGGTAYLPMTLATHAWRVA